MYRLFQASKDTYITDRVIKGARATGANVGGAGSLDLFKLKGVTKSGSVDNIEVSRALIKFDISDLIDDVTAGKIDVSSPTFKCFLKLHDVYGGQPTPDNFHIVVHPLSRSFEEGIGRDVVFYQDRDIANFLTASASSYWFASGANALGTLGSPSIDCIASGNLNDGNGLVALWRQQTFSEGIEDLSLDVTTIISGTIAGLIPDQGFRVAYGKWEEDDDQTRFVKRFASRTASDKSKRPGLIVMFDDSIQDGTNTVTYDYESTLYFNNIVRGTLRNVMSGAVQITGSNCMKLIMSAPPLQSGSSTFSLTASVSQRVIGTTLIDGAYKAQFTLSSSNSILAQKILTSGSVEFTQVWGSNDGTVGYFTGTFTASPPDRGNQTVQPTKYYVVATNVNSNYTVQDVPRIRVHVENVDKPYAKLVRTFVETPSAVPERVHYQIRDSVTQEIIIPFDTTYNSTRLSNDSKSLYFDFYMSNLFEGNLYEIDILVSEDGQRRVYRNVSAPFKLDELV